MSFGSNMNRNLLCCVETLTLIHLLASTNLHLVINSVCFIFGRIELFDSKLATELRWSNQRVAFGLTRCYQASQGVLR